MPHRHDHRRPATDGHAAPMPHRLRRRTLGAAGAAALAAAAPAGLLRAQSAYPGRPLRLMVPFAAGGVTDTSARVVAEYLGRRLGQPVNVENRPGASGNIGTAQVVNAPADGYLLLQAFDGTMVINPNVFSSVPFDTLRDFEAIGKIGDAALILVAHPGVAAGTLAEVVALSRRTSGGLSYGTSGTGGTPHLAGELLKQRTGADLVHVPYKGGGQAIADALGGQIPLVYTAVAGAHGHVKSGKLKAIAVSSARRVPSLPDVPTFIESGIADFVVNSWVAILVHAKTPAPIVGRLRSELNAVLAEPEVKAKLLELGIDATPGTDAGFMDEMRRDLARYAAVVKAAGIKLD